MWEELGRDAVLVLLGALVGFWLGMQRDKKQHKRQLGDETRKRWNDNVQVLKDYLSMLSLEMIRAEKSNDLAVRMKVRDKALADFPHLSLFRLFDGWKFESTSEEDIHRGGILTRIDSILIALEHWDADPAGWVMGSTGKEDPYELFTIVRETNEMLRLK